MLNKSDDRKRNPEKKEDEEPRRMRLIAPHDLHYPHHVPLSSLVFDRVPSSSSSSSTPFHNGFPFAPSPFNNNDHSSSDKLWFEESHSPYFTHNDHHLGLGGELSSDFSRILNFNETGTLPFHNAAASFFEKGYSFGTPMESSLNPHDHAIWNTDLQKFQHYQQKQGNTSSYECDQQVFMQDQNPFLFNNNNPFACDSLVGSQHLGNDCEAGWSVKNPFRFSQIMHPRIAMSPNAYCPATEERVFANNTEFPHCFSPGRGEIGMDMDPSVFRCDNSVILQGKDLKHCIVNNWFDSLRGFRKSPLDEVGIRIAGENVSKQIPHQVCENDSFVNGDLPLPLLLNFCSFPEMATYQNGCRFLQTMVEEGTYEDLCMVFERIIDNIVELMMDPFGNYLVQKLLDVCTEDQRLKIVFMVTKEPGQLARISLSSHGTRVIQKLIENLKYPKEISLVKSAIQPAFLDLIKDLNGNHVIQRCLQCLSCQDNKFIFEAVARFCVEIATHRHGCCVLQRCIDHSFGKERDRLITEICKHALLLAQDPFGNYVVQYIVMMETQVAATKMIGQFRGHYVSLSTQKFSSHVVEKCLKHIGDSRSRIVRELLSAPHFGQVLQDPYGNYVIQSALGVTKGSLHASLVEAVRQFKMLRTSPYCKRIFTGNLLKK